VVVAEGAKFGDGTMVTKEEKLDAFGHVRLGGIGQMLADKIEEVTGFETRVTVLGHIQRGGSPTAFDRVLGTRFGIKAAELALAGDFGKMVSVQGNQIVAVSLNEQAVAMRTIDPALYELSKIFFG
jgi:6-phosphofructokinase 1